VRLAPPLVISRGDLSSALDIFTQVLADIGGARDRAAKPT
jgi:hypothetical protein